MPSGINPSRNDAGSRVESTSPTSGSSNRNAHTNCTNSRSPSVVNGSNSPAHGRSRGNEIVTCAFQQCRSRCSACAATDNASLRQSLNPNSAPMPSRRKPAAYARSAVSSRQSKFRFGPAVCMSAYTARSYVS